MHGDTLSAGILAGALGWTLSQFIFSSSNDSEGDSDDAGSYHLQRECFVTEDVVQHPRNEVPKATQPFLSLDKPISPSWASPSKSKRKAPSPDAGTLRTRDPLSEDQYRKGNALPIMVRMEEAAIAAPVATPSDQGPRA